MNKSLGEEQMNYFGKLKEFHPNLSTSGLSFTGYDCSINYAPNYNKYKFHQEIKVKLYIQTRKS